MNVKSAQPIQVERAVFTACAPKLHSYFLDAMTFRATFQGRQMRTPARHYSICPNFHGFPLPATFLVRRFLTNSRMTPSPARPATSIAKLVKVRPAPLFARG